MLSWCKGLIMMMMMRRRRRRRRRRRIEVACNAGVFFRRENVFARESAMLKLQKRGGNGANQRMKGPGCYFYSHQSQGRIQDFFFGGGALVSCSTSTPINHIVFCFFAEYQLYWKTAGHLGGEGGCAPPAPSP